ncbi:MAG: hypothetical protein IAF58_16380 [Leptolyngbya sp.]|nr:hypothetical protein [Candidatus Melainabacteria bacterium]
MTECSFCSARASSRKRLVRTSVSVFICSACARSGLNQILSRVISDDFVDKSVVCSLCDFTFPEIKCLNSGALSVCLFDLTDCCRILEMEVNSSNERTVHFPNSSGLKAWQPIICKIFGTNELFDEAVLLDDPEMPISISKCGNGFQIGQEVPAFFIGMVQGRLLAFPDIPEIVNDPRSNVQHSDNVDMHRN